MTVKKTAAAPRLTFAIATPADAGEIAALRNKAAARLTKDYGQGHWSSETSEKGVLLGISNTSRVVLARSRGKIAGSLRLATKKPWAIDIKYFTPVKRALYLVDMAVAPTHQRKGIGRALLKEAIRVAREWPADAIRLDAYDADAGAGPFYARGGYREVGRVKYRNTLLVYFEVVLSEE